MTRREVWIWYDRPDPMRFEIDVDPKLNEGELHEFIMDNAPIAEAWAAEWEFVEDAE